MNGLYNLSSSYLRCRIQTDFFYNFDLNQIFLTSIVIIDVTWRNIVTIEQLEIAALFYNSLSFVITFVHSRHFIQVSFSGFGERYTEINA